MRLSSRERFNIALNHQEPDLVPLDLGSMVTTFRTAEAYQRFKEHLGVAVGTKVKLFADGHVIPEDEMLEFLQVDTRYVRLKPPRSWKRTRLDEQTVVDDWGVPWAKPPSTIYATVVDHPIKEPSPEALHDYPWPDPHDMSRYGGLSELSEHLHRNTPYAVVADGTTGAGIFDMAWHLRGMDNLFMDMVQNEEFTIALLDRIEEIYTHIYTYYMQAVGAHIQMVIYYSDVASQNGPLISPAMYRKFIKPRERNLFEAIKRYTKAKLCVHTCGSVYAFLPDYLDVGVDVINPVQTTAKNMEPERLKAEFGDRLSFHGGIDTQKLLPFATPSQIEQEVEHLIKVFGKSGGYLVASCHTIQPDVPPQNIATMFQAIARHRAYNSK